MVLRFGPLRGAKVARSFGSVIFNLGEIFRDRLLKWLESTLCVRGGGICMDRLFKMPVANRGTRVDGVCAGVLSADHVVIRGSIASRNAANRCSMPSASVTEMTG